MDMAFAGNEVGARARACTHARTHAHMRARTHACMHARMQARTLGKVLVLPELESLCHALSASVLTDEPQV